ncbi:MAG: DUF4065 domain-containing protein [Candidatus Campbellbacteria bacterium]|nr:DUF4065 domain-containing protein [Candidatus Campbellbacteria bacterium]
MDTLSNKASAVDIARLFICKSYEKDQDLNDITNMKLLKFLYFAQAISLVRYDKPLFSETIEAWKHGPAVDSVYEEYKSNGAGVIPNEKCDVDKFNEETIWVVEKTLEIFDKYSARELVDITHKHKPWKDVYEEGKKHIPISNESIKNYYRDVFSIE